MSNGTEHVFLALALLTAGGAALFYGLFLGRIRAWRMRRFQRDSGASFEEVQAWFKPSHDFLSDLFKRGMALAGAYPALLLGSLLAIEATGEILGIPMRSGSGRSSPNMSYSLGLSVDLAFICGALLYLVSAERIAGGNILNALPRYGYDYAKVEQLKSAFIRKGPAFSVGARFVGLFLIGIAWFIGSAIADHLWPHVQVWLGK